MTLRLHGPPLARARWRVRAFLRTVRAARQAPPGRGEFLAAAAVAVTFLILAAYRHVLSSAVADYLAVGAALFVVLVVMGRQR